MPIRSLPLDALQAARADLAQQRDAQRLATVALQRAQAELDALARSTPDPAMLQNQQAVAAAQATVDQLSQAIEAQNKLAEQLRSRAERVAALETQREDLLADIATGQDKAAELNALDERLALQKKDIATKGSQAAIDQTVAGLNRKLERARGELEALQRGGCRHRQRAVDGAEARAVDVEHAGCGDGHLPVRANTLLS